MKQLRNGKICVIYSGSFGSGWFSWHGIEELLFDPTLVGMIERQAHVEEMQEYLQTAYSECKEAWNTYRLEDLQIAHVDTDDRFYIHEYDGSETVVVESKFKWINAS